MNYQTKTNGAGNSNSASEFDSLRAEISSVKKKNTAEKGAMENRGFNRETAVASNMQKLHNNIDGMNAMAKYKNRSSAGIAKESTEASGDKINQHTDFSRNSDNRTENLDIDSTKNENRPKLGNRYKPQANGNTGVVEPTKFVGDNKVTKKVQIKNNKKGTRGGTNHAIDMQAPNKVNKPRRCIFRKIDFYTVFVTLITVGLIQGGLIYFFILR